MGLHVGQVERGSPGYADWRSIVRRRSGRRTHGGQLLMTGVAAELLREVVPSQPLGAHRLKDYLQEVRDGRPALRAPGST